MRLLLSSVCLTFWAAAAMAQDWRADVTARLDAAEKLAGSLAENGPRISAQDIADLRARVADPETSLPTVQNQAEALADRLSVMTGAENQLFAMLMEISNIEGEVIETEAEADAPPAPPRPQEANTKPAPDLTLSKEIAQTGLRATAARLAQVVEPPPEDRFALAGVRFLAVIEAALQTRWRYGGGNAAILPVLRLPLPENPTPQVMPPELPRDVFAQMVESLPSVRAPLAGLDDNFHVDIAINDLWFDINDNGKRDDGEDLWQVAGDLTGLNRVESLPIISFDQSDAAWLSAYSWLLEGVGDLVLAYDPTEPLTEVIRAKVALATMQAQPPYLSSLFGDEVVDTLAVVIKSLEQSPDAARLAAAREAFLAMVADNRIFWTRVAAETDNLREWIPNDQQTSALGVTLPPQTGTHWLAVLDEVEAVLKGDLLIPYPFLVDERYGVDLSRVLTEPAPIRLIDWIQGAGAVPYLKAGPLASGDAIGTFMDLMEGRGLNIALMLN